MAQDKKFNSADLTIVQNTLLTLMVLIAPSLMAANSGICGETSCRLIGKFAPGVITYSDITMAGGTFVISYNDGIWKYKDHKIADFGDSKWHPVIGDWNGDGYDQIGLYRNEIWLLREGWLEAYSPFRWVVLGSAAQGSIPLVGDWNGNGKDSIGVYEAGLFTLMNDYENPQDTHQIDFGVLPDQLADDTLRPFSGPLIPRRDRDVVGVLYNTSVQFASRAGPGTYDFLSLEDRGLVRGSVPATPAHDLHPVVVEAEPLIGLDQSGYVFGLMFSLDDEIFLANGCLPEFDCHVYTEADVSYPTHDGTVIIPINGAFD